MEASMSVEEVLREMQEERDRRTVALGFALLPCPFCGGKPYVDRSDEFDADYVQCECGASYAGDDLGGWNSRVAIEQRRQ